MDQGIINTIENLKLSSRQSYGNMEIFPLHSSMNHGPDYLTLGQALEANLLLVTEVDTHGSVPELKVINGAEKPVLLLDGEELAGAKQNRVLNTTILIRKKSEIIIPVSCTEQGRWSYASDHFSESIAAAPPSLRREKISSVSQSLHATNRFDSNQGQVWEEVRRISDEAQAPSHTSAMRDVFETRKVDINRYVEAFPCEEGQKGMLICIGGQPVGLDYVSLSSAYAALHGKLIRSYAMEAILIRGAKASNGIDAKARKFLEDAKTTEEKRYKSKGHGWDHRLNGKNAIGSALVYRGSIVHMAFFQKDEHRADTGSMSTPRTRRHFRYE